MSDKQQTPGDADAQITDASDGEAAAAPAPVSKYNTPSRASVVVMVAIALFGLTLILRAWQLWPFNSSHVHTDDAYVRGQVTVLAPQVSGYVTDVLVKDFDHVKQGQPLLRIDGRSYRQKVDQAEAALAEARAQLANSDQSQAQGRAQIASARANLSAGQAERRKPNSEEKQWLAVVDVDHFKGVNDRFGHLYGDEVLILIANLLQSSFRAQDRVFRFGGEEFVVLLIDADLESASMVAQRIRASVAAEPVSLNSGERVDVTVSIRVAALSDFARDNAIEGVAQELVASADAALYQAKAGGRNKVVMFA